MNRPPALTREQEQLVEASVRALVHDRVPALHNLAPSLPLPTGSIPFSRRIKSLSWKRVAWSKPARTANCWRKAECMPRLVNAGLD